MPAHERRHICEDNVFIHTPAECGPIVRAVNVQHAVEPNANQINCDVHDCTAMQTTVKMSGTAISHVARVCGEREAAPFPSTAFLKWPWLGCLLTDAKLRRTDRS